MRIGADDPDLAAAMNELHSDAERLVFVDRETRLGRAAAIVFRGAIYLFVVAGLTGGVIVIAEMFKRALS